MSKKFKTNPEKRVSTKVKGREKIPPPPPPDWMINLDPRKRNSSHLGLFIDALLIIAISVLILSAVLELFFDGTLFFLN